MEKDHVNQTPQPPTGGLLAQIATFQNPNRREKDRNGRDIPWCRLIPQLGKRYAPWVLIRYNYTDMGFRPLPANTPFWISPDIWVESSDPYGHPVAGEPNFLHARVFNLGRAPAYPTRVQFYWGDPSMGLGAGNMHLIGTEWVYIPQMTSLDVRCNTPWVPVMVNGGHECVMVNSSSPMLDPITNPFQAWLDRHVGQRNLMVIKAKAGQQLMISLAVNNVLPMLARTQFAAALFHVAVDRNQFPIAEGEQARKVPQTRLEDALAAFDLAHMNTAQELQARYATNTDQARMATEVAQVIAKRKKGEEPVFIRSVDSSMRCEDYVRIKLSDEISKTETISLSQAGRLFEATGILAHERRVPHMDREAVLHTAAFQPGERRTLNVELRIPPNAGLGEFVILHLVQRVETVPIGGYTVIAMIA